MNLKQKLNKLARNRREEVNARIEARFEELKPKVLERLTEMAEAGYTEASWDSLNIANFSTPDHMGLKCVASRISDWLRDVHGIKRSGLSATGTKGMRWSWH